MSKVFIFTQTYNSEKVLRRAVESILGQTHTDFTYMITDNASTDKTRCLIEEYARNDRRIIARFEEDNDRSRFVDNALECATKNEEGWWCLLDHDDEYEARFLENTLEFAKSNNLDIAAAGTAFFDGITGQRTSEGYFIPDDLVISGSGFARYLQIYAQFAHVIWNKIFSLSVLKKCSAEAKKAFIGVDTIFTYEAFSYAKRVGILGGTLHKYFVMPTSWSSEFDIKRIQSNEMVFENMLGYLHKRNACSIENRSICYSTYILSLKHSLSALTQSEWASLEKLNAIRDMFAISHTTTSYGYKLVSASARELQRNAQNYILSVPEALEEDYFEVIIEIFGYMQDVFVKPKWDDADLFKLFAAIRLKYFEKKGEYPSLDDKIKDIISNSSILSQSQLTPSISVFMADIVFDVLRASWQEALDKAIKLLDDEIPHDCIDAFLTLSQNIAAIAENSEIYIYFKKIWTSYLIDCGRNDDAKMELDYFLKILPHDEDFIGLNQRIS